MYAEPCGGCARLPTSYVGQCFGWWAAKWQYIAISLFVDDISLHMVATDKRIIAEIFQAFWELEQSLVVHTV